MKKQISDNLENSLNSYISAPFHEPRWLRPLLREAGLDVDTSMGTNRLRPPDADGPEIDVGLPDDPENSAGYTVMPDFIFDLEVAWGTSEILLMAIRRGLRGIRMGMTNEKYLDVRQMVIETPAPISETGAIPPPRQCLRTAVWWSSRWVEQDQLASTDPLPLDEQAGPDLIAARERGMASFRPIASDIPNSRTQGLRIFGMFVNASFLRRLILGSWNLIIHKGGGRINDSGDRAGRPDPNGRIKLEGISIQIQSPDTLKLMITGYSDAAWPPVPFTLTSTDMFQAKNHRISVTPATQMDVNPVYQWIAAALSIALAGVTHGFGYILALAFLTTGAIAEIIDMPSNALGDSPGNQLVDKVFSTQFLLGLIRLDMFYDHFLIDQGGITVTGLQLLQGRRPRAVLSGPINVAVPIGGDASEPVYLRVADIKYPYRVVWYASPPAMSSVYMQQILSDRQIVYTNIVFTPPPGASADAVYRQQVTAVVTGDDGESASASMDIMIYISESPEEAETAEEANCRRFPWKCQDPDRPPKPAELKIDYSEEE